MCVLCVVCVWCVCVRACVHVIACAYLQTHRYELKQAVKKKSKGVLVCHATLHLVLYALIAVGMIVACVFDWQTNVSPVLQSGYDACTTYTNRTNCAGFNASCAVCDDGFFGVNCSACPGLVDRTDDATNDFVGAACNGACVCVWCQVVAESVLLCGCFR